MLQEIPDSQTREVQNVYGYNSLWCEHTGFPIRLKVKQNFVITFLDIYRMYHEIQDSQTEQVQNVSGNNSLWWIY